MTLRVVSLRRRGEPAAAGRSGLSDVAVLAHDERHLRRKVIVLASGGKVLLDLAEPTVLEHGDVLELEGGGEAEIVAAEEELLEVRPRSAGHLTELAWHIGNRHLAAQIETDRILVLRDHVIKAMLDGLGATVAEAREPFHPMRGAYHAHGHDHHH